MDEANSEAPSSSRGPLLASKTSPVQFNARSLHLSADRAPDTAEPARPPSHKRVRLRRPPKPPNLPGHPLLLGDVLHAPPDETEPGRPGSRGNQGVQLHKTKSMATDEDDTFFLDFGDNGGATTGDFSPVSLARDSSRMEGGSLVDLNEAGPASNRPDLLLPSHVFLTEILPDNNPPNITSPSTENVPSNSPSFPEIRLADGDSNTVVQRYFHVMQQSTLRSCSTCGKYGHLARTCKTLVCWTCGARDAHESRDCPINITCWNCGRRGHASSNCGEPRARRQCQLCGSRQHVQNSCPSLWRIYCHISPERREEALQHRAGKIGLELGEGGEGFIAWDAECFVCGATGHWGYDCSRLPRGLVNKEPPAFSRFHADTEPWPFDSHSQDHSRRFALASDKIRRASSGVRNDADGGPAALQPGREGKEKMIRLAQERNMDEELDQDDNDWFSNAPATAASHGTKHPRRANEEENRRRRGQKSQDPDSDTRANGKHRVVQNESTCREQYLDSQSQHGGKRNEAGESRFYPQRREGEEPRGARHGRGGRDRVSKNPDDFHRRSPRGVSTRVSSDAGKSKYGGKSWAQEAIVDSDDRSRSARGASQFGSKWRGGYAKARWNNSMYSGR